MTTVNSSSKTLLQKGHLVSDYEVLKAKYFACVRNLDFATIERIEKNDPPITTADSPLLQTAREAYKAWYRCT